MLILYNDVIWNEVRGAHDPHFPEPVRQQVVDLASLLRGQCSTKDFLNISMPARRTLGRFQGRNARR